MAITGSTAARGYGWDHQQQRAKWKPYVDAGLATCWRCGKPIIPDPLLRGDGWDLGHHDYDRTIIIGPEHARQCNRAAGGRKASQRNRLRVIIYNRRW